MPLNGIGVWAQSAAMDDFPFTFEIRSVTNTGSNKFSLPVAIIHYSPFSPASMFFMAAFLLSAF